MGPLPIIDLSTEQSPATLAKLRQALLKYGAFRLCSPELKQAVDGGLLREVGFNFLMSTFTFGSVHFNISKARGFFQLSNEIKQRTRGYSGFGTELVRGTTPIPKEGINFFRKNDQRDGCISPPAEFSRSVIAIHDVRTSIHLLRTKKARA
jgi:hypothetical protein